jgi:hypothetical protein
MLVSIVNMFKLVLGLTHMKQLGLTHMKQLGLELVLIHMKQLELVLKQ